LYFLVTITAIIRLPFLVCGQTLVTFPKHYRLEPTKKIQTSNLFSKPAESKSVHYKPDEILMPKQYSKYQK
jgi:hypothetical protein